MKRITISIISAADEPDVAPTLELIADRIENGFTSGFDRNDQERYHFSVDDAATDELSQTGDRVSTDDVDTRPYAVIREIAAHVNAANSIGRAQFELGEFWPDGNGTDNYSVHGFLTVTRADGSPRRLKVEVHDTPSKETTS